MFESQSSLTQIAQLLKCYHKSALNWQKLGVFVKSKLFVMDSDFSYVSGQNSS